MQKKQDKKEENRVQTKKVETRPVHSIHQKRISITQVMDKLQQPERFKEIQPNIQVHPHAQQSKIEEKDRMIKELQEQILQKKLRNDMIQEAFSRRHEKQQSLSNYSQYVSILAQGCKILASICKPFKRHLFRTLLNIFKLSARSKPKGIKMLLIWMISWVTHMFSFLSSTLIKK